MTNSFLLNSQLAQRIQAERVPAKAQESIAKCRKVDVFVSEMNLMLTWYYSSSSNTSARAYKNKISGGKFLRA